MRRLCSGAASRCPPLLPGCSRLATQPARRLSAQPARGLSTQLAEEPAVSARPALTPSRNPNLTPMTPAAARDLLAPIVQMRGDGDPALHGQRPAWWWTGASPEQCPGFSQGQLVSLPQLNLQTCTRLDMLNYFDNTWTLTELLFASLQGEPVFYVQPYHQLRHPLVFYYGHPACLYINKLRLAGLLSAPCNAHYEVLFETGVDEMSWDDLSQSHVAWPTIREVHAYRAEVYGIVRRLIETHPDLRDGAEPARPILAESPLWALAMAFEHERIHLETSAVLMRELPLPHLGRPDGWVALHPSAPATDVFEPEEGRDYPRNGMVPVEGGEVTVGKPADWPSFGWDNEYGEEERGVPPFAASRYKVSNGEMRQFVAAGGYRESRYWSDEGWKWRSFRHARWPTFWTAVGPAGLHHFRLRTLHECVPMPWAWPAEVNVHEAKAYCAWRSEEEGVPYRLTTEGEVLRVREVCGLSRPQGSDTAADPVLGPPRAGEAAINHNLAYGSPGAVTGQARGRKGRLRAPLATRWATCGSGARRTLRLCAASRCTTTTTISRRRASTASTRSS